MHVSALQFHIAGMTADPITVLDRRNASLFVKNDLFRSLGEREQRCGAPARPSKTGMQVLAGA